MIRKILIFLLLLSVSLLIFAQNTNLKFEKNKGQWNKLIRYKADFKEGKIFVLENKINIVIFDSNNSYFHPHFKTDNINSKERFTIFSIQPLDAKFSEILSKDKMNGYTNYFTGRDISTWQSQVPSYRTIIYKNVYANIDWEISSYDRMPKHSYIVHSGGNPNIIKTLYKGLESVVVDGDKLILQTKEGIIKEDRLFVYQCYDSQVKEISARYSIVRSKEGFEVSYIIGEYNRTKDLIIDPSLVFSTYSGAHSDNWGMTSCYDKKGYMISGGIVYGNNYPFTEGVYDSTYSNNWDCVITKYDSLGEDILFSTFLGGQYCEMPHSMVVNNNNEIVILGTTGSEDFPVSLNAFQPQFNGGTTINYESSLLFSNGIDMFVSSLSSDGCSLLASTFIGGTSNDGFNYRDYYGTSIKTLYDGNDSLYANFGDCARGEIVTDANNNVYVASCTFSKDFPTSNDAYRKTYVGKQDAVVFKMDQSLSTLIYSTYLGGKNDDAAYSIDIDKKGKAFVCGGTTSKEFPSTIGAYNSNHNGGSTDAFISVLSMGGNDLEHSTFFGSSEYDQAFFIRLDKDSNPYIFGQTKAPNNTLIHNVLYAIPNSGQFIAKFTPQLDSLFFSTVFGSGDGMINISPSGFNVDVCGRIYCAGWGRVFKYMKNYLGYASLGTDNLEITSDAYMGATDGMDFYIISLGADASQLDYATFIGENDSVAFYGNDHVDGGTSRFDRYGNFYLTICASCGGSQGMPTTSNAYSSSNNSSNCNIASIKFSVNNDFAVADFTSTNVGCINKSIEFSNYSRGDSFKWDFGDGSPVVMDKEVSHTYSKGGIYEVKLISFLSSGCKISDTLVKKILVLDNDADYLDTIRTCEDKPINVGIENLAITISDDVTMQWTPAEVLSDANAINPYATISNPTLFRLIISVNGCNDTLYRFVDIDTMKSEIPDTLDYCVTPYIYKIENTLKRQLACSWNRNFTDTIAMINDNGAIVVNNFGDRYLYIRYSLNGCWGMDSIYLKFSGLKFDILTKDAECKGDATGKAEVVVKDGKDNLHYVWSCTTNDSPIVEYLPAGTYTVKVYREGDTCFSTMEFTILAITNLNIEAQINDATCNNICDGSIVINVGGGAGPYEYSWSNGEYWKDITNLCKGDYTVIVTDNTGCSTKKTFTVNDSYKIDVSLTATTNNCLQGCSATVISQIKGGKEPYQYVWNDSHKTKDLFDVCNGDYVLNITDANGCYASANVEVGYKDVLNDFIAWTDTYKVYDGARINLYSTFFDKFNYFWTPSTHLDSPDKNNTKGTIYETTTYNVFATDTKGCNKSDTVRIEVEYVNCDESGIFVPNVFSPNNDGKNDILYVKSNYAERIDFIIYNRWGEKVFQTNDINEGWDGKYRNNDCAAAVYYYKLEVHCIGGKTFLTAGDITLIR
ncbi:MAG: gliding motility-associated C-terminal domain-containing protein [Bacteroidales bacterium]